MTATTEQFLDSYADIGSLNSVTLQARTGDRFVLRTLQRSTGAAFSIAALSMWLLPFGNGGTAELLCKMMVTLVLAFIGAALWQAGSPQPSPDVEVDLVRREVRLVRRVNGARVLVTRRRFHDLSDAEFDGHNVRLWDEGDSLLAEMTMPDQASKNSLRNGLQDAGVVPR